MACGVGKKLGTVKRKLLDTKNRVSLLNYFRSFRFWQGRGNVAGIVVLLSCLLLVVIIFVVAVVVVLFRVIDRTGGTCHRRRRGFRGGGGLGDFGTEDVGAGTLPSEGVVVEEVSIVVVVRDVVGDRRRGRRRPPRTLPRRRRDATRIALDPPPVVRGRLRAPAVRRAAAGLAPVRHTHLRRVDVRDAGGEAAGRRGCSSREP